MKTCILYIYLVLLIVSDSLYAQNAQEAQNAPLAAVPIVCLTNGHFNNACESGTNCSPAWSGECSAGWIRSHGSPTMAPYTVNGQTLYQVYMWSSATNLGEGMFTPYFFQNTKAYTVKLDISATGTNGKLKVYAANGLVEPGTINCGQPPPVVDKILIGEFIGTTTQSFVEFTFTNNSGTDYTQLWIYPEGPGNGQYNLFIRSVDACPYCDNTSIVYNNGVVPTGVTDKGYIYSGSSAGTGGAGIVTVNGSANTHFYAVHEIYLLPDFNATVNAGTFIAEVYTCSGGIGTRIVTGNGNVPLEIPANDLDAMKSTATIRALNVYPTVSTGLFNITGDSKMLENVELTVFDLLGKRVLQIPKRSYAGKASINLGNLNNGTYLLQINQKDNPITKKIIIRK